MEPKWIAAIGAGVIAVLALPLLLGSKVTMANYDEIELGMTYEQVKEIMGDGKTLDELDPPKIKESDLPPGMPMPSDAQIKQMQAQAKAQFDAMNVQMFVWQRGDEKAISVMLQNGRVVGKTQQGLADQPSFELKDGGSGILPGMPGPGMPMPGMPPM